MDYDTLKVGDQAPDWTLRGPEGKVSSSDYLGKKNVVLLFYTMAFSEVCSVQLPEYQLEKGRFAAHETEVIAVSTDNPYAAAEFARQLGVEYQVLSDMQRAASASYGVLRPEGFTNRGAFVIDKAGIIRHLEVTHPGAQPSRKAVIQALENLE